MAAQNQGPNEWYTVECHNTQLVLPIRYQNVSYIGHGAFGIVVRANDTILRKPVAIKKMIQPFRSSTHAKRTYRELRLLMHLNHPDSQVVQLYNVFTPDPSKDNFQSLYFVFNFVDFDLNKVIRRRIHFTEDHIRQIIYSLLCGLKFIHSAKIIHRDIKPANIGLNKNSDVTIFDFGLARITSDGFKTGYVSTRWWRAPEVFVNWERYNEKLDIWSLGCVMGELITLEPLFPGTDYIDQMRRIINIVGTPTEGQLNDLCVPRARDFIMDMPRVQPADFYDMFGYKFDAEGKQVSGVSEDGVNFLMSLLSFDHRQRPTAEEALAHPFLRSYRHPDNEVTTTEITDAHQDAEYDVRTWKDMIWNLIQQFQPPTWIAANP